MRIWKYKEREMRDLGSRRRRFHLSFEPASAKAASDSASCSRTASTVSREIGIPSVVFVCGEMNSTIDSILSGISFKTPTYFPPPASTIEDVSASLKCRGIAFSLLVVGRSLHISQSFRSPVHSLAFTDFRSVSAEGCWNGTCFLFAEFNRLIRRIYS